MRKHITIIKFGTNVLFPTLSLQESIGKKEKEFDSAARQIATVRTTDRRVVVVTSGAIEICKIHCAQRGITGLEDEQIAAVGARQIMNAWGTAFERHGIVVAQILVTYANLTDPSERGTLVKNIHRLLDAGVVPIINENDPVSAEEVEALHRQIGDNDTLTSMLAQPIEADRVLILTDQEYVFEFEPRPGGPAPFKYLEIDCHAVPESLLSAPISATSRGGMPAKVKAAATCARLGMAATIARFYANRDTIVWLEEGRSVGTKFGNQTVTQPTTVMLV